MKMSLLEIVQDIINDISADFVNTIDDTEESQMVAQMVKSTYFAMMSNRNWPHQNKLLTLTASGTSARPTHMTVEEDLKELSFVNYNKIKDGETRNRYEPVTWCEPDEFLRRTNQENNDISEVDVITDGTGIELHIRNDRAPEFYTSFDDEILVFNAYDNLVDTTLQASKVQAKGYVMPTWTHTGSAVPDMPAESFTALLEEAKSRAAFKLNSEADVKAEQEAGKQHRWLSRKAWVVDGGIKYPNYGRKSRRPSPPGPDKNN